MPRTLPGRADQKKTVACTHCGGVLAVAPRAMSVFCPHCKQRLILENFTVKTYHASRSFATCGDIVVEKNGFVSAPIRAGNLTVKGKVRGNVAARGLVTIDSTGQVHGDINSPRLVVASGAKLQGFCCIQPSDVSQ